MTVKTGILLCSLYLLIACGKAGEKNESVEWITMPEQQQAIFAGLQRITGNAISGNTLDDSLAFLVLPLQASCPSCRKKAIDSIVKYSNRLPANHYIIISINGGRKKINGYFLGQDARLPVIPGRLFLDTVNASRELDLYDKQPTLYYTSQKKAFRKVIAIPATVKEDLREFFSGYRMQEQ